MTFTPFATDQYNGKTKIRRVLVLKIDGDKISVRALNGPLKGCEYTVPSTDLPEVTGMKTTVKAADLQVGDTIRASRDSVNGQPDYRTIERIVGHADKPGLTCAFCGPDTKAPEATSHYGWRSFRPGSKIERVGRR